ncbi:MAG: class I SAM-dependent methyltransferase [Anaerolineales bacterium]|nr:class I SAM-dependent methyltransferase [Anaerolineales bacterium]
MKNIAKKLYRNSSRIHLEQFARRAAQSLPAGDLMLDAGAGTCPYKQLFGHARYESADFCQIDEIAYGEITYVCDLTSIPVEDHRYDLVLCTQVLSQIQEPLIVLKEFYRILKPGKELWISVPFFYMEFPPYDYYRYTQYGFQYLVEKAGFKIKKIEWLEGYYGTLAYQYKNIAACLPINPKAYGGGLPAILGSISSLMLKPASFLLALFYGWLDARYKYVDTGHCKNYAIVAYKPDLSKSAP